MLYLIFVFIHYVLGIHQGAHKLTLIPEGTFAVIPCLPNNYPEHQEIRNSYIRKYRWLNISLSEIDPNADVNYIEDGVIDGHIELNRLLDIMPNGNLIIRNAYIGITGFYECILKYGNVSRHLQTRRIRHQIEVTKYPIRIALIRLPIMIHSEVGNITKALENKVKTITHYLDMRNRLFIPLKALDCNLSLSRPVIRCEINVTIIPETQSWASGCENCFNQSVALESSNFFVSECLQYCASHKMEEALNADVRRFRNALSPDEPTRDKLLSSKVVFYRWKRPVEYRKHCESGFERSDPYCRPCEPGHYRTILAPSCTVCPPNTYQPRYGQNFCESCGEGAYTVNDGEGATSIKDCRHHGIINNLVDGGKNVLENTYLMIKDMIAKHPY